MENRFNNPANSKIVTVSTVKLSGYIKDHVDLLKLDIEGAETEVMKEIEPKLKKVKNIILEYHGSIYNVGNNFYTIMSILKKQGFATKVYLSRWQLPNFAVDLVALLLSRVKKDEYWLRIYAER